MVDTRDRGSAIDAVRRDEMRDRIEAFDWATTRLGPRETWSASLNFSVAMVVASASPMALRWGPDLVLLYNDAYAPMLGARHPSALGKSFAEAPPSTADQSGQLERDILAGRDGGAVIEDRPLPTVHADGSVTEGYFTIRLNPLPDPTVESGVGGVLIVLAETTRRVRAEQALRASEERYQLALNAASGVGTWDWDIVDDKVYADGRYATFHNVDPARAAAGVPLAEYVKALHPDDHTRLLGSGRTHLKTTGDFLEEYRLIQADGSIRWVQTRGRVERDAQGWAVRHRGVMVDITERKRIEQALEATEADLRIAVDAAGLGRWDNNPSTGERYWDHRAREIFGLPLEQTPTSPEIVARLIHPDDLPRFQEAIRVAIDPADLSADHMFNQEYRIFRGTDGALCWIEAFGRAFFQNGQCVRFVGVVSDVTERKLADTDRELREATMALALDAGNVGTWDFDVPRRDLRWSERALGMFGMSPDQDLGLDDFYAAMHPEDREATRTALVTAMTPGLSPDIDVEYRTIGRDDGLERWISAKGRGFFDEAGLPTRVVGATVDITERKKAELHLRLLVNELNHRVKNSLATIQAIAAQTFHAARSLPQAQEAFTARIIALAEAHDLLTRENWEGADLMDLLARLEVLHGAALYKEAARFTFTGPPVRLSPRIALSLSMALHELATNAVKYGALSLPGGQVTIAWNVAPGRPHPRLHLTWTETGGPPVSPPTRRGFGSRLIERGLALELAGEAHIDFQPSGVVCRIEAGLDS